MNCWKNGTSPPTFPSIQGRRPAWFPLGTSSITETIWFAPRAKSCAGAVTTKRSRTYQYVARQKDCQACPIKDTCLPPKQKRRFFTLTMYHPVYLIARGRNRTAAYRRERRRRFTIVEGIFASLDRLSCARSRLRGLWKVDCEGYMAAFAHNVLKLVHRLSRGVGPPAPVSPAASATADMGSQNPLIVGSSK